jgi:hypothetical protein
LCRVPWSPSLCRVPLLKTPGIVLCRLVVAAKCTHHTIGKCILCGENTLHWTTEYCFVQSDWQCTPTTNLHITVFALTRVHCTREGHRGVWGMWFISEHLGYPMARLCVDGILCNLLSALVPLSVHPQNHLLIQW